jgi:hypothetical protein
LQIGVNLSPVQFLHADLAGLVQSARRHRLGAMLINGDRANALMAG